MAKKATTTLSNNRCSMPKCRNISIAYTIFCSTVKGEPPLFKGFVCEKCFQKVHKKYYV